MTISPTIRQLIVVGACQLGALSAGGAIAYPMVLLRQLSGEDSPIKLTVHTASWIGSLHGMAGIASVIIPTSMQRFGRKSTFVVACLTILLGWLVAYFATSFSVIIISELIHGFGTNSLCVIALLSMSEMTSPTLRNVSVQSYSIVQALGMATSGVLSVFLAGKYICLIMSVPITLAFLMSFLWPESPSWLACKGRFEECYEAFRQLRKIDATSKLELEELIAAQKENLLRDTRKNPNSFMLVLYKFKRRDFYLPAIHIFFLLSMVYWSGSAVVFIDSFGLIKRVTNNAKAPFWGGIAFNVIYFIASSLSTIVNKRFNTKTVLLTSAVCTSTSLFGVFLVDLLQSTGFVAKESLLCVYFLLMYSLFDCLGIIPMVFTIVSEVMPVKHRGLGGAIFIIFNSFLFSTAMKISPYLYSYINIWGTFLLYTLNTITCGLFVWQFVPETKNKTLQQIEDFYMFGNFVENRIQHNESDPCIVS